MVGEDCGWIYYVGVATMTVVGFLGVYLLIYWLWMQKQLYDILKLTKAEFYPGYQYTTYDKLKMLLRDLEPVDIDNLRTILNNYDRIQWKKKGD